MKYLSDALNPDEVSRLVVKIPFLFSRSTELRQWTVRRQNRSDSVTKQAFPTLLSVSDPPTPAAAGFTLLLSPPPPAVGRRDRIANRGASLNSPLRMFAI
jgi:hypothetical protein